MFSSSNSREWNFLFLRIPGNDNKPTLVWNCLWNLMLDVQFFFCPIKIPRISSFPFSSIPPIPKHIPAHNDCSQTFGPCKVLPASKRKSLASASAFQSIVKVSRLSDWVCLVVSKLVARHQEALTSSSKVQRGLNPVPWSQRPRRPVRRTNDILGVPNGWGPKKRLLRSKLE